MRSYSRTAVLTAAALAAGLVFSETVPYRSAEALPPAEVVTDQTAYEPGGTAYIIGSGFRPKETVFLQVLPADGAAVSGSAHAIWSVQANAHGDFFAEYRVCEEECVGAELKLTVLGDRSKLHASTVFVDGGTSDSTFDLAHASKGAASAQLQGWFSLSKAWGGTIQSSNSKYTEGDTIPVRFSTSLPPGVQHTVVLKFDFSTGGLQRFIDSFTSYNATVAGADPTLGISNLGSPSSVAIPANPRVRADAQPGGFFTLYNIGAVGFGPYSTNNGVLSLPVTFTVSGTGTAAKNAVIAFGAHLASGSVWGANNGASQFPGASTKAYASLDGSSDLNVAINPSVVVPSADLSITKTGAPDPVFSTSNLTYTIFVKNNGPDAASSVQVKDALPAGLTLVSVSTSQGSQSGSNPLTFSLGTLNAQATATILITAKVTIPTNSSVTNTATVSSSTLDSSTNNNTAQWKSTVLDRTPPVLSCPADIVTMTAPGQCSAPVTYSATATDDLPNPTVAFNPPSGSIFSLGTSTVLCTATDANGNTSSCSFKVTVVDKEAPQLPCPANITTVTDPGQCSAVVTYQLSPTDNCPTVSAVGSPASGSSFPLGTTVVQCTATDAAGNQTSCSFSVLVQDKQPPTVTCPVDIITTADQGRCFAKVNFQTPKATDNCNGAVGVVCTPPSGTDFPVGTNLVAVVATDVAGNSTTCYFNVIVQDAANQSWVAALPLTLVNNNGKVTGQALQCLNALDQSRWYKFHVQPGSRVYVTLTGLPENYDLVLFKDIAKAFTQITSTEDLTRFAAEFATDGFSASAFSPDAFNSTVSGSAAFAPSAFSYPAYSPSAFSFPAVSASSFSPDAYAPSAFSYPNYSPSAFSYPNYSPSAFSFPAVSSAFSAAQAQSVLAVSAFDGITSEGAVADTWGNDGDFYVRVRGRNGVFSTANPFQLNVTLLTGACAGISSTPLDGTGQPLPASTFAASAGNYKTIILTDMNRWLGSGPSADKTTVTAKLAAFAARPEVAGVVVDVGQDSWVNAFNTQADANYACPLAKNLVAEAIKDVVDRSRANNSQLEYVVIVGNDRVIPFFRFPDEALLGPEQNFVPPVLDASASQASLRLNYVLSQDKYGSECSLALKTMSLPLNDLAVGRLVETAAEVGGMLDAYTGTTSGVLPAPVSSLVSGYDFLADDAQAVSNELAIGVGAVPETLICPNTTAPGSCWTADDLRQRLFAQRHDLIFLAGHFSASEALAADFSSHLFASELAASTTDFKNTLLFSVGCHSGYNIVDTDAIPFVTLQPDWMQACARKQVTVVAGTGYQYGDSDFVEYSERLYLEFSKQLRTGLGPVPIGKALVNAKKVYVATTAQMRGIHTKAYLEATLFGLPMLKVNMGGTRRTVDALAPIVTALTDAAVGSPGNVLGLKYADVPIGTPLQTVQVQIKDPTAASPVTATYASGGDGVVNNPVEPILPLVVRNIGYNGQVLRGVGFRGGHYTDLPNVLPLTGVPTTTVRGAHTMFLSEVYYPIRPWNVNYFGALCSGVDGVTRLMLTPAQFRSYSTDSELGTLREFDTMSFRLFYNANITTYEPDSSNPSTPALSAAPAISGVSGITSTGGGSVALSAIVLGNPAAGIQGVWVTYTATSGPWANVWQSIDLTQKADDSRVWQATLPLNGTTLSQNVRYIVQAVSGVGVVALETKLGAYHIPDEFDSGALGQGAPTSVNLQAPPTPSSGAYGSKVVFSAKLVNSSGGGLAQQRVRFAVGSQQMWGTTDGSGIATVNFPLRSAPGVYDLTATFPGAAGFAPSFGTASFTITRANTAQVLAPAVAYAWSNADTKVTDTLKDGAGNPILERTLFMTVSGPGGSYGKSTITDINGSAPLGSVSLPVGTYTVKGYFQGTIPLPNGQTANLDDGLYNPSTASSTLIIASVQGISASPNVLSPPNHRMVPVTITVTLSSNAGTVASKIVKVVSSDPTNTTGDGNTSGDWWITGDRTVQLRAERASSGTGRTYTITVQSTSSSGSISTGTTTVFVPPN
jgi:uncharacterized repeat protein (TIGR01451 family)